MKETTKINIFERYTNYWIVKLGLDKQYNIIVKKDNRIYSAAEIFRKENQYIIQYNTKNLTNRADIIHVVLHEIGHMCSDFRCGNETEQEYLAELFALKTAKKEYPKIYKKMIRSDIIAVNLKHQDLAHKEGYLRALKELNENKEI